MKRILVFLLGIIIASCEPNPIEEVDCTMTDLSLKVIKVKIADCGLENGEITIQASGGSPPYEYFFEGGVHQESNEFKDLGTKIDPYVFFVKDKNGCIQTTSTLLAQKGPFSSTVSVTPSGCMGNNGAIVAVPLNGFPPYKYQLGENGTYQAENYWENLPSGIYSVWIADDHHCYTGIRGIRIPSGISYSETISPIISTNCATEECHGGTQAPDFRDFANIQSYAEKIKNMTKDKSMPLEGSLTDEQIRSIECWVDDGAPAN